MAAAEKYRTGFQLTTEVVNIPRNNYTIEKCFPPKDKRKLYELAFKEGKENGKISKKEFDAIFSMLIIDDVNLNKIRSCLSDSTIKLFEEIIETLDPQND